MEANDLMEKDDPKDVESRILKPPVAFTAPCTDILEPHRWYPRIDILEPINT
jgi:hypothetical protein